MMQLTPVALADRAIEQMTGAWLVGDQLHFLPLFLPSKFKQKMLFLSTLVGDIASSFPFLIRRRFTL